MKNTIKRIITFMMVAAIVASIAVTAVNASPGNPEFVLALGDSITTGYGLDEYIDGSPYLCDSYVNMVAEALGLKGGESYINKAVNGATSTDLLNLIPDLTNYLGYADLIVVTIGGNDLLRAVPIVASALSGKNITTLEASVDVLTSTTPDQFAALANNTAFQSKIGAVLTKYASNISEIAKIIKQNAPDAHVIFIKQYNPMKNVPGFADFGNFADTLIASINTSIETVCSASGFDIADAPSVINENAAGLTNMLNYDIHPNAQGHVALAKLLAEHIGITLDNSGGNNGNVTDPVTEPETEPETEPVTDPVTEPVTDPAEVTSESEPATEEKDEEKTGCASMIGSSAVILVGICALAVLKKKDN